MRLPVKQIFILGTAGLLAGCGVVGQHGPELSADPELSRTGPAADYPMVLGDAFTVDGVSYKPVDVMNYDTVGYAGVGDGEGITIAHRTLPLPSYAEVTSLVTGKTILVRVERRGPMTGARLIELSPEAAAQLGGSGGRTPIRIRRVNPPEQERALLRDGEMVPPRMDTPKSLVAVLRRKLEPDFVAAPAPPVQAPAPKAAPKSIPVAVNTPATPPPAKVAAKPAPARAIPLPAKPQSGSLMVQVGAFSTEDRGKSAAAKVGGKVSQSGKFHRVRIGPFATRGQAEAALAKAKSAGYSDARIQRAD